MQGESMQRPIDKLVDKGETIETTLSEDDVKKLTTVFEKAVKDQTEYKISTEALSPSTPLVSVTEDEFMRRMREMSRTGGQAIVWQPAYGIQISSELQS